MKSLNWIKKLLAAWIVVAPLFAEAQLDASPSTPVLRTTCWTFKGKGKQGRLPKVELFLNEKADGWASAWVGVRRGMKRLEGSVACKRENPNLWSCWRDDDGGTFRLSEENGQMQMLTAAFDFGNMDDGTYAVRAKPGGIVTWHGRQHACRP